MEEKFDKEKFQAERIVSFFYNIVKPNKQHSKKPNKQKMYILFKLILFIVILH